MKTIIRNGFIADVENNCYQEKDIVIDDGVITALVDRGSKVCEPFDEIDASCKYIVPGLIDIHIHGSKNEHFGEEADFSNALDFCAKQGVTTVIATMGTRSDKDTISAIKAIIFEQGKERGARIGGIHLEGPFVSTKKKGAMEMPETPCCVETFQKYYDAANGQVRVMTIAPERENALDVIRLGASYGVRMSIGHTEATCEEALAAIEAGATGATHTFNAMRSLMHREPGVVGAVLTEDNVTCETICDMVHLAPQTVKLIVAAKGKEGVVMVSDSGKIAGMGDGDFLVDGRIRYVRSGVSRLIDGTIAGSSYSLADGARKMIDIGYSVLDIALMASYNPAKAVGLNDRGVIAPGKLADLIITDEMFCISNVILRGETLEMEG